MKMTFSRAVLGAQALLAFGAWAIGCAQSSAQEAAPSSSPTATAAPLATVAPSLAASASAAAIPAPPSATEEIADAGPPPPCPPDMAQIGRYCIDRFEAHLVTIAPDGTETLHAHYERPQDGERYAAKSAAGFFPQAYISRVESEQACKASGKRLCSRAEWTRACGGKRNGTFPYAGERYKPEACNTGKGHLLTIKFGPAAGGWTYDNFNDPSLDQEAGFLAKGGAYEGCRSDEGAYDLVGNLHEWVSDRVDDAFVEKIEAEEVERKHQGFRDGNGVFLGGFFSNTAELGPGCKYITYAHEPTYHDYSTGFRCCADAQMPKREPKGGKKKKR